MDSESSISGYLKRILEDLETSGMRTYCSFLRALIVRQHTTLALATQAVEQIALCSANVAYRPLLMNELIVAPLTEFLRLNLEKILLPVAKGERTFLDFAYILLSDILRPSLMIDG